MIQRDKRKHEYGEAKGEEKIKVKKKLTESEQSQMLSLKSIQLKRRQTKSDVEKERRGREGSER